MAIIEQNEEFASQATALTRCTVQVKSGRYGVGSGVIWRSDGLIVTNAHVVMGQNATVELSDGRVFEGTIQAKDPRRDLAAIAISASDLPTATVGDSDTLRVGQLVLAMGNPLGLAGVLTKGIIHAVTPRLGTGEEPSQNQKSKIKNPKSAWWVKADVRLAPGNSGGPLADAQGRVIGINTAIAQGLALAVPSNEVEQFLQGTSERPYLGLTMQPVLLRLEFKRVLGLLLLSVEPSSPADEAGLLAGDMLIGVSGQFFNRADDLSSILQHSEPGDMLQLDIVRGSKILTCNVVLRGGNSGAEAA